MLRLGLACGVFVVGVGVLAALDAEWSFAGLAAAETAVLLLTFAVGGRELDRLKPFKRRPRAQ